MMLLFFPLKQESEALGISQTLGRCPTHVMWTGAAVRWGSWEPNRNPDLCPGVEAGGWQLSLVHVRPLILRWTERAQVSAQVGGQAGCRGNNTSWVRRTGYESCSAEPVVARPHSGFPLLCVEARVTLFHALLVSVQVCLSATKSERPSWNQE